METEQNVELTPDQEYQGKLKDATSFGGTIYAFTLQQQDDSDGVIHVGPFEFDRPIDPYVGQKVAIRVSSVRTEMGIFPARMRWLNPMPIDRKGTGKGRSASPAKSQGRRRPSKGKPRGQRDK